MGRRKTVQTNLPARMRQIRKAYYYDHGIVDGKRYREPLGSDYRKALKRWAEIESGSPEEGTIGAVIDDYRTHALPKLAERTQEDRRAHLLRLDAIFGRMAIEDMEPHHVARYLRRHSHPVMANREIGTLSAALSWGVEQGMLRENVTRQVKRNPEKPRERRVTDAEYEKVLKMAPPVIACAMELAYCTGMRRGDLLALSWAQVGTDGIRVRAEKTGDTMLLEWTPRLRRVTEQAKGLRRAQGVRGMNVLCRRDGQPYSADGFSAMWQRLMKKAVAAGVRRFTFHDLRAKCATDAREMGLDSQALLGHRTESQHLAYLRSRETRRVKPL